MAEYLERESLLKSITRECIGCDYAHAIRCVRAEKTADVQPVKRGKWIPKYDDKHGFHYICSNCDIISGTKLKFCFDCGADMRGE